MEMKIKWLATAIEDTNNICDFLALKSPSAASDLYDCLLDAADELIIFPEAGQIESFLEDYPECFRYLVVKKHYKMIYTIKEDYIEIVDIWDCRRNPSSLKRFIGK